MAFATLADDTAFDELMAADIVRAAVFVFIDWPDEPIYASTHVRSVTAAGKTWTGVGAAGVVETDTAQQSAAAQRWTVGLNGVPASPVHLATQVSAIGVDAEVYLGAFDAGWQTPVLKLMFAGYADGRRTKPRPSPTGFLVDVSLELSDGVTPRRAVQFHWADGVGAAGDTAQRLLYTVARSVPWPG